jgi:hypothetical protein
MAVTSFPFLKIARDHGLPYGDVIRVAQDFDDETFDSAVLRKIDFAVRELIYDAVEIENLRREHARNDSNIGGVHFPGRDPTAGEII